MPTTDTSALHMIQCWLDPRRLVQLGKMLHLPLARTDTNYLVHCALGELFGDDAPKPFFVDDDPRTVRDTAHNGRYVRVLGYADTGHETLREEAKLCPNPTVHAICDWDRFVSKAMPTTFQEGRRLGFALRACPVIRKASAGEGQNADGKKRSWHEGQELDAFLAAAWEHPEDDFSREDVYRDWLTHQFDARGGGRIESVGLECFSIERMTRRVPKNNNGERKADTLKRPDVTLTGTLTVTDGDAFSDLLRSGLGRHKSFGFGMLKVRRA